MLSKLNRNMKHLKDNSWHVFTILLKCKGLLIVNQRVTFYVESEGNQFHPNDADYSNQVYIILNSNIFFTIFYIGKRLKGSFSMCYVFETGSKRQGRES